MVNYQVEPEAVEQAHKALDYFGGLVKPVTGSNENLRLLESLTRMFAAYPFGVKGDKEALQLKADVFMDELSEYPIWAIQAACKKWVRTQQKEPTVIDLRSLAYREIAPIKRDMIYLEKLIKENKDKPNDFSNDLDFLIEDK